MEICNYKTMEFAVCRNSYFAASETFDFPALDIGDISAHLIFNALFGLIICSARML